jgi:hypothetical protein
LFNSAPIFPFVGKVSLLTFLVAFHDMFLTVPTHDGAFVGATSRPLDREVFLLPWLVVLAG